MLFNAVNDPKYPHRSDPPENCVTLPKVSNPPAIACVLPENLRPLPKPVFVVGIGVPIYRNTEIKPHIIERHKKFLEHPRHVEFQVLPVAIAAAEGVPLASAHRD